MVAVLLVLALVASSPRPAGADAMPESVPMFVPDDATDAAGAPQYGMYYDRYEPSFYTGFAPRARDPRRIHLHLGRGNQLRITVVLSDAVLESYARDLLTRARTYRMLVDEDRIELTQNLAFEEFEATLRSVDLEGLVAEEGTLSPAALRARNLALLERLNPGRIFRIRMPAGEVVRRWAARVLPGDRKAMTKERQLELLNLMLPTRLFVAELDAAVSKDLQALVRLVPAPETLGAPGALDALQPAFFALFERVTYGFYPERDGNLVFAEFTAIHPNGSFNEYTVYRGHKIPMFPTPGRRALTTHQRTKTVDHVPEIAIYSYFPWIPYMHVGTRLHNSIHTVWWKMEPARTSFLPASWHTVSRGSRSGKPFRYLWLLSRGPMSHGCTHLNAGHISELRQVLPSETKRLYDVDTFLNKSHLFDVFDIDGDFQPEVMGVRYFIAYSLRNKQPDRLRAPIERRAYYDWLYGGELRPGAQGGDYFEDVRDCRFIGRTAVDGTEYGRLPLYEAEYEPERVQFYRMVDIPFTRELRKVSVEHPFPGLPASQTAGG